MERENAISAGKFFAIFFKKDAMELIRERKTLVNIGMVTVFLPLLFLMLLGLGVNQAHTDAKKSLTFHVVKENAYLDFENLALAQGHKVEYVDAFDIQKITNEEVPIYLVFDHGFQASIQNGNKTHVKVYYSEQIKKSRRTYNTARSILRRLESEIRSNRKIMKGLDLSFLDVFDIKARKTDEQRFADEIIYNLLHVLFLYSIVLVLPMIAPDIITGERERKFLEPLLQLPISRIHILLSRAAFLFTVAFVASVISLSIFLFIASLPAFQEWSALGTTIKFSFVAKTFCMYLSILALMSWAAIYLCSTSRSIKEAQIKQGISIALIFGLSTTIKFFPEAYKAMLIKIPVVGQAIYFERLKSDLPVRLSDIAILVSSTLGLALLLALACLKLYKQERLILGKISKS